MRFVIYEFLREVYNIPFLVLSEEQSMTINRMNNDIRHASMEIHISIGNVYCRDTLEKHVILNYTIGIMK